MDTTARAREVDFTFVTYDRLPDLDPDDRLLAEVLVSRGFTVRSAVWSDPEVDWSLSRTTVIRSTWDYHLRYRAFLDWTVRAAGCGRLVNPAELVRWNSRKTYLRDLAARGARTVPTTYVEGEHRPLGSIVEETGWTDLVIKPLVGLATSNVQRVRVQDRAALAEGDAHLARLVRMEGAMIQPYVSAVATTGERALMFFGGEYSHAVRKSPFQTLAIAGRAGEEGIAADDDEIAAAHSIVAGLEPRPVYARVDLVRGDEGRPLVMELELIEPSLFLALDQGAAQRIADVLVRHVRSGPLDP